MENATIVARPAPPTTVDGRAPLIFVGHSHIRSVAAGAALSGKSITTVPLRELKKDSGEDLRSKVGDKVAAALRENANGRVFGLMGGGMHAALGIVQHPEPFDFVMPDRPDLPFDEAATLVPFEIMERLMARKVRKHLQMLRVLTRLVPTRLAQLEPPPPIKDNSRLRNERYEKAVKMYGVSQPWLRYKLWALQGRIFRAFCEKSDIDYVPTPREALDADGFLAEPYWGDFVHGNGRYGALVLEQLEALPHG